MKNSYEQAEYYLNWAHVKIFTKYMQLKKILKSDDELLISLEDIQSKILDDVAELRSKGMKECLKQNNEKIKSMDVTDIYQKIYNKEE